MTAVLAAESLVPLYVIAGYLALLVGLGLVTAKLFKGTSADYFVVSRSIGPFLLLMSVFGTTMTGFALVGSTGKAYESGIGVYGMLASWSGLVHSMVFFLIGIRLWAIGKRYGYMTQCAYFRDRFDSNAFGYLLFPILVLLLIPYLLVGVIAAGKFLQATTSGMFPESFPMPDVHLPNGKVIPSPLAGGLPPWLGAGVICFIVLFYVFFGGLRGAVWANTMQTIVFMVTGIIAFYTISNKLGGLSAASELVASSEQAAPRLARGDQMGQLQFMSYFFVPLSVGMFPHLFQHWLTAKSAKSFRLTVVAHPIFIAIVWVPCILIGIWAAAHFGIHGKPNTMLGRMVGSLVHDPVLSGLVGAGVLAAIMSSLDSQFMCLGTMFTTDVVTHGKRKDKFTDKQKILISRLFILGIVLTTYLLALYMMSDAKRQESVFDLGVWCFSGFAALFPLVFASVYWRRVTRAGAFACIIVTAIVWSVFFYRDILAVKPEGSEDEALVLGMMPVTFIFLASAVSLVVVSLLTKPLPAETVDKFFIDSSADAGQ
ncbi:MAG: sodium:solute symporter family protein [Phycisphaera sp.]|nr:sodium:solute symporter family protein [Phycisphaera sp.]